MNHSVSEAHSASIVDYAENGIVLLNHVNDIILWNRFMERHSGIQKEDIIGRNIFETFPYLPKSWLELKLQSVKVLKNYSFISWTQRPYLFQFNPKTQMVGDTLEYMYQDITFIPILDKESGNTFVCLIIKDVTDIVRCKRQIEEMKDMTQTLAAIANHDTLTSIYNRDYVEKQLKIEFNRAKRYNSEFSIILFDIDHFKKVNDTYGHLAGDEVLKKVSRSVTGLLRDSDIFGRFGGEEFIIILPNATEDASKIVTEKLRQAIESLTTRFISSDIRVTISLGFVQYNKGIIDYLQMAHESDLAMYHSKKCGRNISSQFKNGECIKITM